MTWLAALDFARKHLALIGCGILLLYIAILKSEVRHEKKLRHNAELSAQQCANGREADRKAWADGKIATAKLHKAQKRADEALHEQIRIDTEKQYAPQLDAARQRLADYARLHPAIGAAEGSARAEDLPRHPQSAGQPDGPGSPAIVVSLDDANRCTEAVVRLKNARDWALQLQNIRQVNE